MFRKNQQKVAIKPISIHPDHLTLTGLELSIRATKELIEHGGFASVSQLAIGQSFDGLDGLLARRLDLASPEGAVKDVLADRIIEAYMVSQIVANISLYIDDEVLQKLQPAFNLSTLTKAACKMLGVKTSEGGTGSMIQRRWVLFSVLRKVHKLKGYQQQGRDSRCHDLAHDISSTLSHLVADSQQAAKKRMTKILDDGSFQDRGWDSPALEDASSPAAVEARKYVAVVRMNERFGFNMIGELNDLAEHQLFPDVDYFEQKYDYICRSLETVQLFLNQAIEIVHAET